VPVALLIGFTLRGGDDEAPDDVPSQEQKPRGFRIPWGMVLFGVLCGGLSTTTSMYVPYYLADIGQGSPDTVAMVLMIGGGTSALTAFSFGWIRSRFSAIQTFVYAFALIAAGLLVVAATGAMAVIVVGWAVYGLGLGLIMPNLFSACAGATPPHVRAQMLGFVRSGVYGGPLLIQPVLEAALGRFGAFAALAAIACLSVISVVLTITLRKVFDPVE